MFRQIYEAALALFLVQGVAIPLLLLVAGWQWHRQIKRMSVIEAALADGKKQRKETISALLKALPKLQPLNCASCGAPLALDGAQATCTGCRSVSSLPDDYLATMNLRRVLPKLAAAAVRHWRVARLLTFAPTRWFFRFMVLGEPALFVLVLIGAATFDDTWADRLFERIGEGWSFAIMLMAFGGFILWMVVFIFLASLAKEMRVETRDYARPPRMTGGAAEEFSTCRSCGGGLRFGRGRLAALCGYCTVPNFRAAAARQERAQSEDAQADAQTSLFCAMEIVEGFTGTFFVTMSILTVGFVLLIGWIALTGE